MIGDNSHQIMLGTSSIAPKSNGKSARRSYPKSIPQMQPNTSGNMGHNKYTESIGTAIRRRLISIIISTPFFIEDVARTFPPVAAKSMPQPGATIGTPLKGFGLGLKPGAASCGAGAHRAAASGDGLARGVSAALSRLGRMIPRLGLRCAPPPVRFLASEWPNHSAISNAASSRSIVIS